MADGILLDYNLTNVTTFSHLTGACDTVNSNSALVTFHWINFILITIVAVSGVISQTVVVYVITRVRQKTSTDVFLVALSIVDIFLIIFLKLTESDYFYEHVISTTQQSIYAGYISTLAHPLEHIMHFVATWCVTLMSFDRYLSVCHAVKARNWCSTKKACLQLAILALVAVLYSFPRFLEYYPVLAVMADHVTECGATFHEFPEGTLGTNQTYVVGYTFLAYLIIMYIIPLGILCFTNYHLIRVIRSRKKFHKTRTNGLAGVRAKVKPLANVEVLSTVDSEGPNAHASNDTIYSIGSQRPLKNESSIQRQYDHVIRMLIAVTVIFSICQIPDMMVQLLSRLFPSYWAIEEFRVVAYDFVMINSSLNLFIYTATSKRFKNEMYTALPFLNCQRKVAPHSGATTVRNS